MTPAKTIRHLALIAASSSWLPAATMSVVNVDPAAVPSTLLSFDESHGNGMVGWSFEVITPLTISQIGWYDAGKDGLSRSFQVGLWKQAAGQSNWATATQLIGSSLNGLTIPAGTAAALNGSWRVVNLSAPLVLGPGNYQIGGLDSASTTDPIRYVLYDPLLDHADPLIRIGPFYYADGLGRQTFGPSENFYLALGLELGPMLFAEVPEPGTGFVVVAGGLLLALRRRKPCVHGR